MLKELKIFIKNKLKMKLIFILFLITILKGQECYYGEYIDSEGNCQPCETGYYCPDGINKINCNCDVFICFQFSDQQELSIRISF